MRDADVREAVHAHLSRLHAGEPNTMVVNELGLNHGEVLVDVAVVNGELSGFELKSDRDTLVRLPRQVRLYSAVLDRAVLIAAQNHIDAARRLLPRWWGLWVARGTTSGVELAQLRSGRQNPKPDPLAIAQLLWKDEALEVLEGFGGSRGLKGKARRFIYAELACRVPLVELRRCVRERLRARSWWRRRDEPAAPPL